jgi:UDP-N-acetylglucosamine:LPS N-acetylglucosamine transferase
LHLFVDISSHGFGHLAITAPVLNALAEIEPNLHLTLRSSLPLAKLHQRIHVPFEHFKGSTDFGYEMIDATRIDRNASAAAYRAAHAGWATRVATESEFLSGLRPDLVLTNVSYLPLAAAETIGIPACSLCSLNWADLFAYHYANEDWAAPIHAQMLAAYRSARHFLRVTPGMPMERLGNVEAVGPIAALGQKHDLGLGADKAVLVAMGGIAHHLPVDHWPRLPGIRWLVAGDWQCQHPDAVAFESFGLSFTDLLCSVDAVITKPGYGTFTEAACNGRPVLFQRREDWPEQDCLIDWLEQHGRCGEIDAEDLLRGHLSRALEQLWQSPERPAPVANGARQAAERIRAAGNRAS